MATKKRNQITPVVGLQWGDEGKGKGVARIASTLNKNDLVVRFQGGNNAGHTIFHKGKKYVFHLVPSGVFGKARIHLGAGMVIDPIALEKEIKSIPKKISFLPRLSVSPHATLTLPTHVLLDSVSELSKGKKKIGSTNKGIGPSYVDLVGRNALRVGDITQKKFKDKYIKIRDAHKKNLLNNLGYKVDKKIFWKLEKNFRNSIKFLSKLYILKSNKIVVDALEAGHKVIAEGAQGALLDVRFGNYPYVTSSHTIASGVGTGLGVSPDIIGPSIGIMKAYATKVGEGPFPTELGSKQSAIWCRDKKTKDEVKKFPRPNPASKNEFEIGVAIRQLGAEIGATTGRLRRIGWIDIPLLKETVRINNSKELVLTKLDILNGFKTIKACTHYIINGKATTEIPFDLTRVNIKPIYKAFPVWKGKLSDYGKRLPKEAIAYVKFLEKILGAKIIYVGTGPEDHEVVERYW